MASPRLSGEEVEELVATLEELLEDVEAMEGGEGTVARDAVAALATVYGEALARVLADAPPATARRMADDPLVGHLMVLHGLHPDPVERRVADTVAGLGSELGSGGSLELAGVDEGVAKIRVLDGAGGSHGLSPAVRDAILGMAPELSAVEAVVEPPQMRTSTSTFIPLDALRRPVRR